MLLVKKILMIPDAAPPKGNGVADWSLEDEVAASMETFRVAVLSSQEQSKKTGEKLKKCAKRLGDALKRATETLEETDEESNCPKDDPGGR